MVATPSVRGVYYGLLATLTQVERLLEQVAWALSDALLAVPVVALALVAGLVAWRGRRPIAGIVAALAVQVAAFTDAWSILVLTLSMTIVVAVVSAPVVLAVAYLLTRLLPRLPGTARDVRVTGPLAAMLVPAAILGLTVPTGDAWFLAMSLVSGGLAGIILGGRTRPSWPDIAFSTSFTALGVVVLTGLLGGPGLGGELLRTVPTREVTAAAHLVVALTAACAAFLALRASPGQGRDEDASGDASGTARHAADPSSDGEAGRSAGSSRFEQTGS
jgi:ABC-type proline/glycine betaine transport system permease subunit